MSAKARRTDPQRCRLYGDVKNTVIIILSLIRTCLHKKCVRIFEHNFAANKAKIRRRAVARQGFLTQSAAKFAEKTCAYACEDRFLDIRIIK